MGQSLLENPDPANFAAATPRENLPAQPFRLPVLPHLDRLLMHQLQSAIEGPPAQILQALARFRHEIENIPAIHLMPRTMVQLEPPDAGHDAFAIPIQERDREGRV